MSSNTSVSLSIVVPVHKVQGYLRQCLESLLVPDVPNLELIAVDDASPDGCGAILDEFAGRDPRVRVKHLTENVGLGEARNIGLDMAEGDYVWFVDSDDYATDGAVRAIHRRLDQTRPDVLMFDYARSYWNGRLHRNIANHLFREPPPPEVFRPEERQSVLELMMTAWNRAFRREFLLRHGLRFGGGYYEDINVTYPLLMAAEKISMLDRVCVIYRQRRRGAITKTFSDKHFDVFAQYDRVFAFMDAMGPRADQFRPLMYNRTLWHLMVILDRRDRVRPSDRERFFREMSALARRYKPADYRPPDDPLVAKKHRLIEKGDYGGYRRLVFWFKVRRKLRVKGGEYRRKAARRLRRSVKTRIKSLYYRVQLRMPLDENLAMYAAYWYRGYSCNPAAIYEAAKELAPGVRGVWVVGPDGLGSVPEGVDHVLPGTPRYYRLMARAKYFVNNVNWPNQIVKRRGQVHLMTQHGTPLKRMGLDQMDYPVSSADLDIGALIKRSDRWDFLLSSNPLSTEAWDRGFPCRYQMLEIGYPRNDRLVKATEDERARLRAELGLPEGRTAILYAPTHRDYQARYTPMFDIGRFLSEVGPDYVLLLRAHYYYKLKDLIRDMAWPADQLIDVSGHPRVEDLAIASDALLTDYSSIMFDYANLDRPIVLYVNDLQTYQNTRGLNFDITSISPGVVATTEAELIDAFASRTAWSDTAAKARSEFRARFCPWDDGHAAERAVRRVFLGEQVPNPPR
ncbi:CDP-glycerol glycerophosphotransferase family protein [Actinomadura sp. SCN-SB]|uniref:bifunctional glycosyltransferase/CDP-glycerol:glycerophosphate glycerophosphotransferase n=1 Tax=Actinomadura sp. SCN-SB TaxID=3373092 RepID=UPI00375191D8